jgi:hypothetical protein
MKYLIGDISHHFFSEEYDAICCTTNQIVKNNGELVMGAGIAKVFVEHFPGLPKIWGKQLAENKKRESSTKIMCTSWQLLSTYLIAFPTKLHWKDKSPITLIERSAEELVVLANQMNFSSVLLPKPGCANGGLNWEQVKPLLEQYLDDRFTIIDKQ